MSAHRVQFPGVAIMLFLLLAPLLIAQPQRRPPRERVEQYKKMKLVEVLDLGEEEAVRFFAKYNKHEKERQALRREMMETINQIERMVGENAPDPEFEKDFTRLQELERKLDGERQRFLKDLREILAVQQIGKLIVFERNFAEHVQEIMRKMRRERWRNLERH